MNILSLGAGVNSTALLLKFHEEIDAVIFADTGAELPETYAYLNNHIIPFLKARKIPFNIVRSHLGTLEEYSIKYRIIPLRMRRWCTDKFKVKPIAKWLRSTYPNTDINVMLGIDYGELHRMRTNDIPRTKNIYPLVDAKMNRNDCLNQIKEYKWAEPVKSGCYFCPFQRKDQWLKLLKDHPFLYDRAERLEKTSQGYPNFILYNIPLEKMRLDIKYQQTLDQFDDTPCGGWCMR